MICQICKHEWCWVCKEDFPVHQPECPNFYLYQELLAFQGMQMSFDGDQSIHPNGWFMYTGATGSLCFWFVSVLFLFLVCIPCIVVFNILVTPVYMLALIFSIAGLSRSSLNGREWFIFLVVISFILLYSTIPIVFLMVTIPQLTFHLAKKLFEVRDLCKYRCRKYRKLSV